MTDDQPAIHPATRLIPCGCGFDLRGRLVGERCPECGQRIDSAGPGWCTTECLHRLLFWSRIARVSCLLLLVVPVLFVLGVISVGGSDRIWIATRIAFLVLMPLQIGTQALAVWRMATPELGAGRVRALRIAAIVRIGAFAAAIVPFVLDTTDFRLSAAATPVYIAAYLLLPLLAIGSDFVTLGALGSLRRESEVLVSGWHAVMPPFARWGLIGVYLLLMVPIFGWFFAPIGWTIAMSIGFAQVRTVAEACRTQLP